MKRWVLVVGLSTVVCSSVAMAENAPAREIRAARISAPISIDGVLSEPAWRSAETVGGFRQRDPNEGAEPTQPTEVWVLFDEDALYIGARLHDGRADSIVSQLSRRDTGFRSDQFKVYLDPYYDRRSGYYFGINAAGTLFDGTLYNDGWSDNSWDAVWEARSRVDDQGWTAEMRIPFSQLRFPKTAVQRWGINFNRSMGRGFEDSYLVYQPRKESGFVSRFPTLVGIENVTAGSVVEVVPYLTSKAEFLRHAALDPFNDGSRVVPNLGGDLRTALGDKLTLNATINPDFGQVEVDPAVVNLSDVETFFPEKRPFFVEGNSIFRAGQQGANDYWSFNWSDPTFFYSRRIGRAPQGRLPGDTPYRDVPNGTTILGASKLSGKIASGLNFGTLHAITSRETADFLNGSTRFDGYAIEPITYYGVGRVLKEFEERRHGLGVITTVAARSFEEARLEDEFNHASMLGVVDGWTFLDADKRWVLSGWAGGSYVDANAARMTALRSDSRHYFQRPDAESFDLEPGATSLAGTGARLWLNKEQGNWFSNSAVGYLSPGFDVNDLGFISRADVINAHAGLGYKWTRPTRHVKNHNLLAAVYGGSNFDRDLTDAGVWGSAFWWFRNDWTVQIRGGLSPETVNPRRSRGGPRMLNAPGYNASFFFDTDGSRKRYYYVDAEMSSQPGEGSWSWRVSPFMNWKPRPNVVVSVGPGFERSRDGAYPFTTLDDAAATHTYGRRYLFARLDQTTLSANIRFNVSFTPTMSLEFFGQPLVATGEYRGVRELARPRSLDFIEPGSGPWTYDPVTNLFDPDGAGAEAPYSDDFNFKSLRGNAVFRWEYQPGSTLFLVWTQERTDEEEFGEFRVGPSFRRLVDAQADNIFLAKLTYYLNL